MVHEDGPALQFPAHRSSRPRADRAGSVLCCIAPSTVPSSQHRECRRSLRTGTLQSIAGQRCTCAPPFLDCTGRRSSRSMPPTTAKHRSAADWRSILPPAVRSNTLRLGIQGCNLGSVRRGGRRSCGGAYPLRRLSNLGLHDASPVPPPPFARARARAPPSTERGVNRAWFSTRV